MTHAFFPPSGASGWINCALWPTMNDQFPSEDTPESMEGTAAHEVAWAQLANRPLREGQLTSNGIAVTDEMLDGADLLIDTIRARIRPEHKLWIEEQVSMPMIHPTMCFGTPDAVGMGYEDIPGGGQLVTLHIIDYKFGHRFVDEYFNPQGLLYLAGHLQRMHAADWKVNLGIRVEFTIVQPRCHYKGESVRSHRFVAREGMEVLNRLRDAAERALEPNPTATTNPACKDCAGRHACPALQLAAYSDAEFASAQLPVVLKPSAAALELRMLERAAARMDARIDGLKAHVEDAIRAGEQVRHYALEPTRPREQWTEEPAKILAIGDMFRKDLRKIGVVTPNQAKKAGMNPDVVNSLTTRPAGTMRLVPANPTDAAKVFGLAKED